LGDEPGPLPSHKRHRKPDKKNINCGKTQKKLEKKIVPLDFLGEKPGKQGIDE